MGYIYKYYDDPYVWPNIFKNNQNKIYDADLILPGQSLIIHKIFQTNLETKLENMQNKGLWVVGYRKNQT